MSEITYGGIEQTSAEELQEFYTRMQHDLGARPGQIEQMMQNSAVFITARVDGRLIGIARGLCDGLRGYLTECKLDPQYQGPAAVTRKDGRIEHDKQGIGAEMARRVIKALTDAGVHRIDVLAWGTEEDFCEELGFKRQGGLVGMTMHVSTPAAAPGTPA